MLLPCVSAYPARVSDSNLGTILHLGHAVDGIAGLSDHTPGSVAAVAPGAAVIEKHVTLRRVDGGPDAAFSLAPDELGRPVRDGWDAWAALGRGRSYSRRGDVR